MSPRAAWRLETLGFTDVYDYVAGKTDWSAAGLPTEGRRTLGPRAADALETGVRTCGLDDRVRGLALRPGDLCVVTHRDGVVLGRIDGDDLGRQREDATAEDVMRVGPTTIRPTELLESLVGRMRDAHVDDVLVTDPDGRLIGLLTRARAEDQVHRQHAHA